MNNEVKHVSVEKLNNTPFNEILKEIKEEGYTCIYAKEYYLEVLKYCMLKNSVIPNEFYYMITPYKSLQKFINKEVISEFLNSNSDEIIKEIIYNKNLKYQDSYYLTSSYNINNITEVITKEFYIYNIDDEYIGLKGKNTESIKYLKDTFKYCKDLNI